MHLYKKITFSIAVLLLMMTFFPTIAHGAAAPLTSSADTPTTEVIQDVVTTVEAKVLKVNSNSQQIIPGTDTSSDRQSLEVEVLEGAEKGNVVDFDNDYVVLKQGDLFYLTKTIVGETGQTFYSVSDPYRMNVIFFCVALFVLLVLIFGGKQGLRGLISLIGSLILVLYVLLPGILHGYSPIFISIGVASLIIIVGSYVTHGFTKTTTSAVIGMITTVAVTSLLAYLLVHASHLTGFDTEESVYLNFDTRGHLDFVGLLLGGMLIGFLGVLYDAAIGQAIAVEELHHVAPHLSRSVIFKRAIRIGKEHIGALVNTLAIAYVGVSLPLLLLFSTSHAPLMQIINKESFSTEIIRAMVGSIGLVLAVPITTLLSVLILIKVRSDGLNETLQQEEKQLEEFHHHH